MYGTLAISTSGLVAQRTRMDAYSANIANQGVILNAKGEYQPFRRLMPMLATGDPVSGAEYGVHVAAIEKDDGDLMMKYEPNHPFANDDGYVGYPNISPVVEQMNAMEAARGYEANIAAVEATKSMISLALQLLA